MAKHLRISCSLVHLQQYFDALCQGRSCFTSITILFCELAHAESTLKLHQNVAFLMLTLKPGQSFIIIHLVLKVINLPFVAISFLFEDTIDGVLGLFILLWHRYV